ncbi:MAG: ABC transporter ATP-binding protein [Oscillospiraceae bacterium]
MYLQVKDLWFKYQNAKEDTLKKVSFTLEKGNILGVLGESGSGKSTVLRLLSGLEKPESGSIIINDNVLCDDKTFLEPEKRNVGVVFQDYALFPHMTVEKNIVFGIREKKNKKTILDNMLNIVNLEGFEKRYPHELSGGQQQRVALARALAFEPETLLLDEPFSNLDANLQQKIRVEVKDILKKCNVTAVFVSHNIEDIKTLSDYVLEFKKGEVINFYKNEVV